MSKSREYLLKRGSLEELREQLQRKLWQCDGQVGVILDLFSPKDAAMQYCYAINPNRLLAHATDLSKLLTQLQEIKKQIEGVEADLGKGDD